MTTRRQGSLSLVATLLVAACTVGPPYERPEVKLPAAYFRAPADTSASIADVAWWQVFDDPGLVVLIREALSDNLDLRIAAAQIVQAQAQVAAARSPIFPQVSAQASAARGNQNPAFITTSSFAAALALSWELDLWGKIRRGVEAEEALVLAAEEGRRAVVVSVVGEVARVYFEMRDLDARAELARATVVSRRAYVDLAEIRFRGGVTSELDFRQAQSELGRTQSILADLERQGREKENELSILLGRPPEARARGLAVESMPLPPAVPAGLPSQLLERRPDLRAAEQQLVSANARIGEAKALMYPQISLTAVGGFQSTDASNFLTSSAGWFW